VPIGTWLSVNDRIGHASCEGGSATGKHVHIARKYHGEWLAADGPIPIVLSGWRVIMGERPYLGKLVKGNQEVVANPGGPQSSIIQRDPED
jgi:hypothetical protein